MHDDCFEWLRKQTEKKSKTDKKINQKIHTFFIFKAVCFASTRAGTNRRTAISSDRMRDAQLRVDVAAWTWQHGRG
jgi:hypothetical protein